MATVTNTIKLPDGTAPTYATAKIELIASANGNAAGWVTATDVTVLAEANPTVTAGAWTATLTPNADIDPAGTVYRVTEHAGRHRYVHHIEVGSGGGTVHDLLVDPPASLATAGSEAYTDAAIARLLVDVSRYDTFADAIEAAEPGATVFFPPGDYTATEHTPIDTAGLTLLGYGATITGGAHQLFVVNADDVTLEGLTLVRSTDAATFSDTTAERSCVAVDADRFTSLNCDYTDANFACLYFNNGIAKPTVRGGIFANSVATQNGCAIYAAAGTSPTVDITIDSVEVDGTAGCPDGILLFDCQRATVTSCHVHDLEILPTITIGANWSLVSGNVYRTRTAAGTNPGVDGVTTDRDDGPTRVVKLNGTQMGENTATPATPSANQWGISAGYLYINLNGTDPNTQTVTSGIVGGYGIMLYSANTASVPIIKNRVAGNRVHDVDGFGIYLQLGDATGVDNTTAQNTITAAALAGDQHTSLPFAGLGIIAGSRTVCVGDRVSECGTPSTSTCDGVKVLPGATNIGGATFLGCTSNSNTRRGFAISNDCVLLGCEASGNTLDGVNCTPPAATAQTMRNIAVIGGKFQSNGLRGIAIDCTSATASAKISGTTCSNNTQNGILVLGTVDTSIVGNECTTNGATSHAQIRVRSPAARTSVVGNVVHSATASAIGILVDAGTTNTVVTGNTASLTNQYSFGVTVRVGGTETVGDFIGSGDPAGAVTAGIGSTFRRTDGGTGTTYYVKESGTGSSGWVAK